MSSDIHGSMCKKPTPLYVEPPRRPCPVCGKQSYSLRGIHPQCAVLQADAPRQAALAEEKRKQAKARDAERLRLADL